MVPLRHRLSLLSLICATVLTVWSLLGGSWKVTEGHNDLVAPGIRFRRVRVGTIATCVTLARSMTAPAQTTNTNGTSSMVAERLIETCYSYSASSKAIVNDVHTDQWVTLPSLCTSDRLAIARSLGIPMETRILDVWDAQCAATFTIAQIGTFLFLFLVCLAVLWACDTSEAEYPFRAGVWSSLGAVLTWLVVGVWRWTVDVETFDDGPDLRRIVWAAAIFSVLCAANVKDVVPASVTATIGINSTRPRGPDDRENDDDDTTGAAAAAPEEDVPESERNPLMPRTPETITRRLSSEFRSPV